MGDKQDRKGARFNAELLRIEPHACDEMPDIIYYAGEPYKRMATKKVETKASGKE